MGAEEFYPNQPLFFRTIVKANSGVKTFNVWQKGLFVHMKDDVVTLRIYNPFSDNSWELRAFKKEDILTFQPNTSELPNNN